MKTIHIIGVLVFLLLMVGSASACSMSLTKSVSPTTYFYVGQTITYTYKVTCTAGPVYGPIILDDNKIYPASISLTDRPNNRLKTNDVVYGTASYTITQDDLDRGTVTNKATAKGKSSSSSGRYNVISNEATATVTAVQNSALSLEKSASPATYDAAGQTITYKYVVTNTGNVAISGPIKVTDNKIGTFTISNGNLASGTSVEGTATYKILPADLTAGSVTNTAHATGTFSGKDITSEEVTATVTSTKTPPPDTQIPEFPSIALPVASILGLMFISQYKRKEK
ncbi:DUF7507 domain-containing protein [Methanosarcina sp.]|uniref:DUF7507 domain-containing protein n=1 Tax=Methanosarcina sp. TaxID=2213 RepID=UPI003BB7CEBF